MSAFVALQVPLHRLLVPGVIAVVGVYLAYAGGERVVTQKRAVRRFVAVDAMVKSSKVGTRGPEGKDRLYYPVIRYTYSYDGEEYESETVFPGGNYDTSDRERVKGVLDSYPINESATAYVDPEDPERSYLTEGDLTTAYFFLLGGVVLVLVAAGLALSVV